MEKTPTTSPILGVPVAQVSPTDTLRKLGDLVQAGDGGYVCVTGVHGVMESQRSSAVMAAHRDASLVVPDGMPLVWVSRIRGYDATRRVYGPDLLLAACHHFRRFRHFFFGGGEGVAELLAANLRDRFSGVETVGTYTPPFEEFSAEEKDRQVERITAAKPDLVWVGLSTPRQELWMHEMAARLRPAVLLGVGAAFDFIPGLKPQAPVWMRGAGLEWLFRLSTEPRRLGPRYLVNNPTFLWKLLWDRP